MSVMCRVVVSLGLYRGCCQLLLNVDIPVSRWEPLLFPLRFKSGLMPEMARFRLFPDWFMLKAGIHRSWQFSPTQGSWPPESHLFDKNIPVCRGSERCVFMRKCGLQALCEEAYNCSPPPLITGCFSDSHHLRTVILSYSQPLGYSPCGRSSSAH